MVKSKETKLGEYPVYIDGTKRGSLQVSQQGLYTVFFARAEGREPLQLWVFGGGKKVCLGRMLPCGGGLSLRRRLTRNDLRDFPAEIEYGMAPLPEKPWGDGEAEGQSVLPRPAEVLTLPAKEPSVERPLGASPAPSVGDRIWYEQRDGSLLCFQDGYTLVALPARLRDRSLITRYLKVIDGQEYLVFRR